MIKVSDGLLLITGIGNIASQVQQYVLQRINQLSDKDPNFGAQVVSVIGEDYLKLNNYHVMGQRGLSTAFTRSFLSSPSGNGSLVAVQEIAGGILKRGLVDVVLETQGTSQEIFTVSCICELVCELDEG
jgi:microsomal triglyceride transfer protein large subunit